MKNAKDLMLEYTAFSFRDPKKAAEMFAEDGAFELPYLATFGLPTEYKGRDSIAAFFQFALKVWMALQHHGLSGYRASIEHDITPRLTKPRPSQRQLKKPTTKQLPRPRNKSRRR
jgi:hypothetical protein